MVEGSIVKHQVLYKVLFKDLLRSIAVSLRALGNVPTIVRRRLSETESTCSFESRIKFYCRY